MSLLPPEIASLNIQPPMSVPCRYQRMVLTNDGQFYPLLAPKGYQLYNTYKRNILAAGSRKSGKTLAVGNRALRHLWETDGAIGAVIAKTTKNAKIGVWRDLADFIIPGWEAMDSGFRVLERKTDPATKMEKILTTNMHGTTSELQLHSLDYCPDVSEKFKSGRFSLIWLSEADQFEDKIVWDILEDQLRIIGLDFHAHLFLFDCNPPDEGTDHWLWSLFYAAQDENSKFFRKDFHDQFSVFEFGLDDNCFLDERERENLINKYKHDPLKYGRFVEGKWLRDVTAGHFDEVFLPNICIKGSAEGADRSRWEVLTPQKGVVELYTGSDPGAVNNHACTFLCTHTNTKDEKVFNIFDEICSIGTNLPIRKFAYDIYERVKLWNKWMKDNYGYEKPPTWFHFADDSVAGYDARAHRTDAQIFYDVSEGAINLIPVVKGRDSINQRIEMVKRLFFENRLNISAHCRWNIAWARFLKPGRQKGQIIAPGSNQFKHTFDSVTYALRALMPRELYKDDSPSIATGIITIGD